MGRPQVPMHGPLRGPRWWASARATAACCLAAVTCTVPQWSALPAAAESGGELVIDADAPDPEVLVDVDGRYWVFTTQVYLQNVPVRSSADLHSWSAATDALPQLGSWASWGFTWSPGVERFGWSYVMFYSARSIQYGVQCIGRAVATSPGGPYVDPSDQPVLCQPDLGGSIDADIHRDATGAPWLVWKSDGDAVGVPCRIWSAPLAADGSGLTGPATALLESTPADEGIVENPTMVLDGDRTVLVVSVGPWWTARYREERAVCAGPRGPCQRQVGEWLGATSGLAGPGGGSLFRAPGGGWMLAVHAWRGAVGYEAGGYRAVWIGPVDPSRSPMWFVPPPPPTVYLRHGAASGAADVVAPYGDAGDIVLLCDWDGDDDDTVGVFRGGGWYLRNASGGGFADVTPFGYGMPGDRPICGDWDGDGDDTVGVVRGGGWYLRDASGGGVADHPPFGYGEPSDMAVVGDWDGDGDDTVGVVRGDGWYLRNASGGGFADVTPFGYGVPGDRPICGDWDGDGDDTAGVFRSGRWYLRDESGGGVADLPPFGYGNPTDRPLAADGDGDGDDGPAVARGY